ncbi:MAG TPA: hypothetical protein VF761_09620 [Gemmatimonadaceae bacterium]
MIPRIALRSFVAALCLAAACSDSNAPNAHLDGVYELQTIDGAPLPVTVFEVGTYRLDLVAGDILFAPSGTFIQSLTTQDFDAGVAGTPTVIACSGRYKVSGSTVTLTANVTPTCEGSVTATISGSKLTITDPSIGTALFEKQ